MFEVVLLVGLAGCVPELSRQYVIGDQVWAQQTVAVRPVPGDVLYLTTWANGMPVPSGVADKFKNSYPPMVVTERIPLRNVDEGDSLLPLEAALLGAVIATRIQQAPPNAGILGSLKKSMESEQVALWNSLVASLILVRDQKPPPAGARPEPMQLQLDETAFCTQLMSQNPGDGSHSDARKLILKTYLAADDNGRCDAHQPSDLRKIGRLETALAPLTEIRSNILYGFYSPDFRFNTVSTARIELQLAGVSLRERDAMEARWTLAQWDAARTCRNRSGAPVHVSTIKLGWHHRLWLRVLPQSAAGAPQPAEIEVRADPASRQGRKIQVNTRFLGPSTISHDSLKFLYPADISGLTWGTDGNQLDPGLRWVCTVN